LRAETRRCWNKWLLDRHLALCLLWRSRPVDIELDLRSRARTSLRLLLARLALLKLWVLCRWRRYLALQRQGHLARLVHYLGLGRLPRRYLILSRSRIEVWRSRRVAVGWALPLRRLRAAPIRDTVRYALWYGIGMAWNSTGGYTRCERLHHARIPLLWLRKSWLQGCWVLLSVWKWWRAGTTSGSKHAAAAVAMYGLVASGDRNLIVLGFIRLL
jgi:hypothetical protein